MKKFVFILFASLILTACNSGNSTTKNYTVDDLDTIPNDLPQQLEESNSTDPELFNIRIDIDKKEYTTDDTMIITLTNLGGVDFETGYGGEFDKWNGKKWEEYPIDRPTPAIAFTVKPGETFEKKVEMHYFEKGVYRIKEEGVSAVFLVK